MPDPYTTLAELLRKAAEKWPEKFQITDVEYMHFSPDGGLPKSYNQCIELAELSDPIVLSQDDMDAICGAVGMWFDVHHMGDGTWYGNGGTTIDYTIRCDTPDFFPDKRTASVHATIACLRFALEEKGRTE